MAAAAPPQEAEESRAPEEPPQTAEAGGAAAAPPEEAEAPGAPAAPGQEAAGSEEEAAGNEEVEPHVRVDARLLEFAILALRKPIVAASLPLEAPGVEEARQ